MKPLNSIKTAFYTLTSLATLGFSPAARAEDIGTAVQCLFSAPKYDVVWRHVPGSVSERVEFTRGISGFIAKRNQLAAAGWRVQQLQSSVFECDGRLDHIEIAAVFRYEPGVYEQYALGLRKADFGAETTRIWNQGLRIHALDSYYVNGEVYYNAMIRQGNFPEGAFFDMDVKGLQTKVNEMLGQGWQVNLLDRFDVNNAARYNVTFRKMLYQNSGIWGWSRSNFEVKYNQMRAAGWNLFSLSAAESNPEAFDAFWTNAGWGESRATRLTAQQFANQVVGKVGADVHTFVTVWD